MKIATLSLVMILSLSLAGCGRSRPDGQDLAQVAGEAVNAAQDLAQTQEQGRRVATAIAEATGVSLSPLVGMCVIAVADYFNADEGQGPWYASLWFLAPAVLILLLVTFKDTLGEFFGPLKKPLDMLDELLHLAAGILAAVIVIPEIAAAVRAAVPEPGLGEAARQGGAALGLASRADVNWSLVLDTAVYALAGFLALLAYGAVWLLSNAVNVLTILLPAPFVGLLLKCLRLGTAGVLLVATLIHPVLGLAVAAVVILTAWKLCGWSFRLLVMGLVFSWDFLSLRWKRFSPLGQHLIRAFAARKLGRRTPRRSYGVLLKREGKVEFLYRPWLVLATRRLILNAPPGDLCAAKAHLNPSILAPAPDDRLEKLFNLPPRYKTHEGHVASTLGLPRDIRDISLLKKLGDAGRSIRGAFRSEARGEA